MNQEQILSLKKNIVAIGRLLWEKELVTGLNGNISARVDEERLLITGHKTCLGLLQEKDILLMKTDGGLLEEGQVSSENMLHREIYKNFPEVKAVVHTHTAYTNAYFLENEVLRPQIFESRFYLGEVHGIKQNTPSVTDAVPVIAAFKQNNIVVLRNHGVVSVGQNLFDCFLLIQCLEESVKIDAISRLYRTAAKPSASAEIKMEKQAGQKTYKLFSKEQIDEIVRLVNEDNELKKLGEETQMTMDLAVQLNETGQTYSFQFENGRIVNVGNDQNAEFLITAPETVWRAVFKQEIDPFVATTQKKMNLRGDFAKISKWYAPCSRLFELWQKVPVE